MVPDPLRVWLGRVGPAPGVVTARRSRSGAVLVSWGDDAAGGVVKIHRAGTDPARLARRLRLAVAVDEFVGPHRPDPVEVPAAVVGELDGPVGVGADAVRWASMWPRLEVLDPARIAAVGAAERNRHLWYEAGRLLAGLHRRDVPDDTPPAGDVRHRLERAVRRLQSSALSGGPGPHDGATRTVLAAVGRLAPASADEPQPCTLVHGDWHLGQLGRRPGEDTWRLIDVDDLGVGPSAQDLARPAGFWAAGLVPDADWASFIDGYRDGGGPALPGAPDEAVWPALDRPARMAVVAAAACALLDATAAGTLDGSGAALVRACHRMVTTDP